MEIFELLLDAGGHVDCGTLKHIINEQDGYLFIRIMRKLAFSQHDTWSRWGIFRLATKELDVKACEELVTFSVQVGADLNYEVEHIEDGTYTGKIIDMAARRGDLSIVQTLLSQGAKPTGDTLASAVSSGSLDVVMLFLQICRIDSIGTLRITPLAAAISLKDTKMMKLLEEHGAWSHLARKDQFASALRASSEAGDVNSLLHLVNLGGEVTPRDLGMALMKLAQGGHNQAAYLFIDVGANLDTASSRTPGDGPPLLEALKRRNEELVMKLLDAGANPNYGRRYVGDLNWREPAIQLAAEWGKHSVIERLIFEGVDVNDCGRTYGCRPALSIAVDKQDKSMLMMLVAAGADLNHQNLRLKSDGPLAIATKKGDIHMARILLDHGADPHDSVALKYAALLISSDILDLILARHRKVYLKPMRGFGNSILNVAVLQGNEGRVTTLLKSGMDSTALVWDEGQETSPFGMAITHNQPNRNNIVKIFLEKDCDPNSIVATFSEGHFEDGAPPRVIALLVAVSTNEKSLVELLVRKGARVNFPARGGIKRTPIQRAAERGLYEMVEYLVRIDADVNAAPASRGGGTALQLAAANGSMRTVQVLLDHKADVDAPFSKVNGRTALEAAAEHGRLDTVKLLLSAREIQSRGLDRPQFERARQHASRKGHFDVVEMLEDYEAQNMQIGHVEEQTGDT